MKMFKYLIIIIFLSAFNLQGQTNDLNLNFLITCFEKGQTDVLEHSAKVKFSYGGIDNVDDNYKTLKFTKTPYIFLNLTYDIDLNQCVFVQLLMQDDKLFYKIKNEILNFKPQLIKTYNEDNGIISEYKGNKFTYRIITDLINGIKMNVIVIKTNE